MRHGWNIHGVAGSRQPPGECPDQLMRGVDEPLAVQKYDAEFPGLSLARINRDRTGKTLGFYIDGFCLTAQDWQHEQQ